ncbi:MAG TPA: hypothetical protein VHQ70_06030 [Syntrophomonadaceae bacterium]|nr:hypothetical protein [Syntrophomonadaceae bacterium]
MKYFKSPWLRLTILLLLIASLFYLPTREFLKITFMLGIPFVFIAGFAHKQKQHSPKRTIAVVLLAAVAGVYVYSVCQLPQRIEIRRIIANGSVLVQEGKYDNAIAEYTKLEKLGQKEKMQAKIEDVEREKKGERDLELAGQLIKKGDYEEACRLIEAIPHNTRAAREAVRMLESIPDNNK